VVAQGAATVVIYFFVSKSSGAALSLCNLSDTGCSRLSLPTGVASCVSENCSSLVVDRGLFGDEEGVGFVLAGGRGEVNGGRVLKVAWHVQLDGNAPQSIHLACVILGVRLLRDGGGRSVRGF
jgi:hypothetical protein